MEQFNAMSGCLFTVRSVPSNQFRSEAAEDCASQNSDLRPGRLLIIFHNLTAAKAGHLRAPPNCRSQKPAEGNNQYQCSPPRPFLACRFIVGEFFVVSCRLPWEKASPNSSLQVSHQCYRLPGFLAGRLPVIAQSLTC